LYYKTNCFVGFVTTNLTTDIPIPTQSDVVPVKSVFGWVIIHQHIGFTFNWNFSWAGYKAGFGSTDTDFWLGLERMHLLTSSQPYRLRVEVQQKDTELWFSAEYWSFKIGDELNDRYRLELDGYSGDAGDSLRHDEDWYGNGNVGWYLHNGMMFSTHDQDNDNNPAPAYCVPIAGGGWWYNQCHYACLTCNIVNNVWWSLGASPVVVNSRMMIKPQ